MSADNNFYQLLRKIQEENDWLPVEEDRICELVKELQGNKDIKEISLTYQNLGYRFAEALSNFLKVNTSVTKLNVGANNFGDEGARAISDALKVNQSIQVLFLGGNKIGAEGARAISDALKVNQSVHFLNVVGNNIGAEGAREIADLLKVNRILKKLVISNNNIGAEGVSAISDALKVNSCVTELYMERNGSYSPEEQQFLLEAMQFNGSLTICRVPGKFQDEVNALCKRNVAMHEQAKESVVHLLALRTAKRILWIPKEIMVMIGQMLWRTKCDLDAWEKQNHE